MHNMHNNKRDPHGHNMLKLKGSLISDFHTCSVALSLTA